MPVKESSTTMSGEGSGLKNWQLALLIGVPTAAVVAYLLYQRSNKDSAKKSCPADLKGKQNAKTPQQQTQSAEEVKKAEANKTPLEKAVDTKNKGNKFFQSGKFEEAAKCYAEAIELCPTVETEELAKFYQNRAAAFENLKQYSKVIEDCTSALSLDPAYTKALMRRAKAYENTDQMIAAFEDLTALCICEKFSNNQTMTAADKMVKKIGEEMSKNIFAARSGLPISKHFVNNFYIALLNDPVFHNTQFYEEVKSHCEGHEEPSHMLQAIDHFYNGDYNECIQKCGQEVDSSGEYALVAINLRGSLYMLKCQYKEALADFNTILSSSDASARLKSNTYIKKTALNLQHSQEAEAFDIYEKAAELDPTNEDIYCNRAQIYAMKGKFPECYADYDKCIELNPDNKIAKLQKAFFEFRHFYAQMVMYRQSTGQQIDAKNLNQVESLREETEKLEKMLIEYSDVPESYNLYAQILSEQENYEKAEAVYSQALEKDPTNAALLVQRALNHMSWKNDFEESMKMLHQAIVIDATCEFAYETLATIEIQRGNLIEAVEWFTKAIEFTRSEESMTNLCCMMVGARSQFKVLQKFQQEKNAAI